MTTQIKSDTLELCHHRQRVEISQNNVVEFFLLKYGVTNIVTEIETPSNSNHYKNITALTYQCTQHTFD